MRFRDKLGGTAVYYRPNAFCVRRFFIVCYLFVETNQTRFRIYEKKVDDKRRKQTRHVFELERKVDDKRKKQTRHLFELERKVADTSWKQTRHFFLF